MGKCKRWSLSVLLDRGLFLAVFFACVNCAWAQAQAPALRIGHFMSVTHAQGVIAHARSEGGTHWLEDKVQRPVEWYVYAAGPSAMEALLAGSIDIAYVGPNPVLNLFLRTKGRGINVMAGAARGGSGLVVNKNLNLSTPNDFRGKKVATPQFGNTQDIEARSWFVEGGLAVRMTGGDVFIVPTEGPDQLLLFRRGDVDAAWTVEPWLSMLEQEADGRVIVEGTEDVTTVVAVSSKFLKESPEVARAFLGAHAELTTWIQENSAAAMNEVREGLQKFTGRTLSTQLLERCWGRLRFSTEISENEFSKFLSRAQKVGFLKNVDGALLHSLIARVEP